MSKFDIKKTNDEQRLVFGWANVSTRTDGELIEDLQNDVVEPEELEKAAYEFVLKFRNTGERHKSDMREKGKLVESVIFTKEKLEAMEIPEGTVPLGWWVGFHIDDDEAWKRVKKGEYGMFSIEGKGERVKVEEPESVAKSFLQALERFNPPAE